MNPISRILTMKTVEFVFRGMYKSLVAAVRVKLGQNKMTLVMDCEVSIPKTIPEARELDTDLSISAGRPECRVAILRFANHRTFLRRLSRDFVKSLRVLQKSHCKGVQDP